MVRGTISTPSLLENQAISEIARHRNRAQIHILSIDGFMTNPWMPQVRNSQVAAVA
jgi:hypothetical protein